MSIRRPVMTACPCCVMRLSGYNVAMRLCILILLTAALGAVEVAVTLQRVVDGDTIIVTAGTPTAALGQPTDADGSWRVRLVGIDTAESMSNAHGEAMPEGLAAKAYVRDLLPPGTALTLWSDVREVFPRDATSSHRVLAYVVMSDGRTVQERVIAGGWSVVWQKYGPPPDRFATALFAAQAQAEQAQAGAWGTNPIWMRNKANERTAKKGK